MRHYADVGLVAAVIAEAIEADTVAEMTEKNNIVLEGNVRSPSTAATTATTAAEATTTAAAEAAATAAETGMTA